MWYVLKKISISRATYGSNCDCFNTGGKINNDNNRYTSGSTYHKYDIDIDGFNIYSQRI